MSNSIERLSSGIFAPFSTANMLLQDRVANTWPAFVGESGARGGRMTRSSRRSRSSSATERQAAICTQAKTLRSWSVHNGMNVECTIADIKDGDLTHSHMLKGVKWKDPLDVLIIVAIFLRNPQSELKHLRTKLSESPEQKFTIGSQDAGTCLPAIHPDRAACQLAQRLSLRTSPYRGVKCLCR